MIKQLRLKSLLLLCALIVGSLGAWGESITFNAATDVTKSVGNYSTTEASFVVDGLTWKAIGYGTVANTSITLGKGNANYLQTPALTGDILSIKVTCSSASKYYLKVIANDGTEVVAQQQCSEDSGDLTFNVPSGYRQLKLFAKRYSSTSNAPVTITKVVVTYASALPSINASDVNIAADILAGNISYSISNPDGSTMTAIKKSGDWLTVGAVDAVNGKVAFTATENTDEARNAVVTLNYGTVSKDVTVSQAAAVAKYVVTIETPSNGTLTLKRDGVSISSGDLIPEGTELDIEAVPALGYSLDKWEYSINGGSTWTDGVGTTYTVTSAVSLRASFSEIPQYTVTLSDKGEVLTELYGGEGVELPARKSVGDYTFVGWSETDVIIETTSTPTVIPSGKYSPTANKTLYPIYTRKEGSLNTITVNIKDYATAHSWTTTNGDGQYSTVDMGGGVTVALASTGNNGKVYTSKDGIVTWRAYDSSITITSSTNIFSVKISNKLDDNYSLKYLETTLANDVACEVSGKTVSLSVLAKTFITDMEIVTGSTTTYYYSHPVTTATITINSACTDGEGMYYATYSNDKAFVVSDEIEVSEISIVDGKLYVEAYKTGDVVPANTGVMVAALAGGSYTVDLSNEAGTSVLGSGNMLKASSVAMGGDNLFYRLTMHKGTDLGFYWGAADGAAFDIAPNKAYLAVPKTAGARIAGFNLFENEGEATAIKGVKTVGMDAPVFNLNGQRVNSNAKGLLIKNGKKFMNR